MGKSARFNLSALIYLFWCFDSAFSLTLCHFLHSCLYATLTFKNLHTMLFACKSRYHQIMIEAKINFINICNGVFTIIADFCNFNKNMNTAIFVGQKNLMLEFHMALSNPNTHSSLKLQLLILLNSGRMHSIARRI